MQVQPTPVVLFLVDISGYTQFMLSHEKNVVHSQMIIGELLETLIREIEFPLELVELEGDALFMYASKTTTADGWEERSRWLVERVLRLFHVFGRRVAEIEAYSICRCPGCSNLKELKLKVVAHSGEGLITKVGKFPVLAGVDTIKVHRLLKNSVEADQYVLMTESAHRDLRLPEGAEIEESVEDYDIGTMKTYLYFPEESNHFDEEVIRGSVFDSNVAVQILRDEVQREYTEVANNPTRGFHFNTGLAATQITEYDPELVNRIPESVVASFAGMGNPFSLGELGPGEHVVDVGAGAGLDTLIAGEMVGLDGRVIGVDMTAAMIEKARAAATDMGIDQVEFREGFAESLPVPDEWADVIISNGVVNLAPDKSLVFKEMFRVLRPGGRLQIADITVSRVVPEGAKRNIDLWTN